MNTLLIVEDEKESRQAVKTIVRRSGVPVSNIMECGDGRTALEILENQQVDLMLTGIRMPGMDGVSLVEAIQGLKHKPLVAVISGCDDFACAVRLMRMGVRDYLLKPGRGCFAQTGPGDIRKQTEYTGTESDRLPAA